MEDNQKKFEINDNQLEQVTGGVLSWDASEWLLRNRQEIYHRAEVAGTRTEVDELLANLCNDSEMKLLPTLKIALSAYISVDMLP